MRSTGKIKNGITEGPIFTQLLMFFFPVLLGTLFQQLYNTVDAVIVGRFVGKAALAAVGGSSAHILNLIIGFFTGVSSGAAVIISQYYGAKDDEDVSRAVHTALILAAVGGALMTVLGLLTAPWLLRVLNTPQDTMADSLIYLQIIYIGMAPSMVFKDGRPYLAIGAAGGPRIITGTLQGIVNAVDFGMLPEQLVRQPYLNCLTREQGLELEFGISEDTIRLLEQKGHRPVRVPVDQAMSTMLNSVMYVDGEYHAAGTQRVDGCGGALLSDGHMVLDGISQED